LTVENYEKNQQDTSCLYDTSDEKEFVKKVRDECALDDFFKLALSRHLRTVSQAYFALFKSLNKVQNF
jgi:hypothetical protein